MPKYYIYSRLTSADYAVNRTEGVQRARTTGENPMRMRGSASCRAHQTWMPKSIVCSSVWSRCGRTSILRACVCVCAGARAGARAIVVILSFYNSLTSYELSFFGISNFAFFFSFDFFLFRSGVRWRRGNKFYADLCFCVRTMCGEEIGRL